MRFNGANAAEIIDIAAHGGRVMLFRNGRTGSRPTLGPSAASVRTLPRADLARLARGVTSS